MKNSKSPKSAPPKKSADQSASTDFLVVGSGAAAGGINALKEFFANVPADSGIAYVVILHLSPDYDRQLAAILQTVAAIPVTQVSEQVRLEPNHVYVVPPNKSLKMVDGFIIVPEIVTGEERRAPVDIFLRTLAESKKESAAAIILSDTGANGSSAAEELETSREELQSVNEELTTVNRELKVKVEEISQSNNDFQNLINSTDIGTIFLDRNLRVNLFSPAVREIFNLISGDEGRELSDITNRLENDDLTADARSVLETLQTVEREVQTVEKRVYLMKIVPYRTGTERINGLVVTFVNITVRKQAEEALIESAARLERQSRIFETTLSSISDFAYTFDKDGRFIYSNQSLLDLLGITLEEIIGKNFFDLDYPHELAARLQNQIQRVFDHRETVKDETPFINLRGEKGFYEYIFSPVKAADGSVELVAGSTRDVTERKSRETILMLLAEISQDLARLTDIGAIMRSVGAKIGDFLGLSNCTFMEISEPADEAVANHEWHRADAPDLSGVYRISEFVTGEFQRASRAGETFVVNDTQTDPRTDAEGYAAIKVGAFVSVPLIRHGEWLFLLVVFDSKPRDWKPEEIELIRELKTRIWMRLERSNIEQSKRESEERFRALIDKGVDVITICDRDGTIKYASPSIEAMTGYTVKDFVNHNPFGNTIHPDDEAHCQAALQEINENPGKSVFLQHRYLHKSGEWRWLEGTFTGFFHVPAINGLVANFRDTTAKINAEKAERERETLKRLVNAQESERRRLARDLHDHLGQQLTVLRLKLEAMRKSCKDEEMCGKIDESQLIAKQIDSDVSFIAWELRPAALDDFGLAVALENYVQEWSHHSGVTAEFHTNGLNKARLPPETETNLYRIVQEALNNVYKHANAGRVTVMLRKVKDEVVLIVEDDGDGFDVEDKIENGGGLGLPGMRERAALVGGTCEIESGKTIGTAVFIRVPVAGSGSS